MGTSNGSFLDQRLDADALPLAVGDFLALALVLTIGVVNHNGVDYLSAEPVGWLLTLVPFLLGWGLFGVLASPLFEGGFAWTFAAVILATGLLALVAWRWLYFKLLG